MNTDNQHISHFAWCALVALSLARQDGSVTSPAQENLYLTRWLAQAEKQKRFSREVAGDISWLLKEGRNQGSYADLPGKLEYLWRDTQGDLHSASDFFRLQHALHGIQLGGWEYTVLSEKEWTRRQQLRRRPAAPGLYISSGVLEASFDSQGKMCFPLPVHFTGNLTALNILLKRAGWWCEKANPDDSLLHILLVT